MPIQEINLVLGIWGATLASYLALLRIREYRHQSRHNVRVFASASPPFNGLGVEVLNEGRRPVTITSIRVGYGHTARGSTLIHESQQSLPARLEDGDLWMMTLDRDELTSGRERNGVAQASYHLVWVTVETANRQTFIARARIDPSIISRPFWEPAREYIAADLFLGFSQMESLIEMPQILTK